MTSLIRCSYTWTEGEKKAAATGSEVGLPSKSSMIWLEVIWLLVSELQNLWLTKLEILIELEAEKRWQRTVRNNSKLLPDILKIKKKNW